MKMLILAGVFTVSATASLAHSPLESTTPADGATIAAAPSEIIMDFKGDIRLTRLVLMPLDGLNVDLDLSAYDGFISDYAVPLNETGRGSFVIEWRGLGADGHALTGTFGFTVE